MDPNAIQMQPTVWARQDKKEEKAWKARCKKSDNELRVAGKELDAAHIRASKLGVSSSVGRSSLQEIRRSDRASRL